MRRNRDVEDKMRRPASDKAWQCDYCGGLQPQGRYSCANCGAPRSMSPKQEPLLPKPMPAREFWM